MKIIRDLIKNPLTIWINWLIKKWILEFKYRKNHLSLGYMAMCHNCKFGKNNVVYEHVKLSNVSIDDYSYISSHSTIQNTKIGKFCSIGPNVRAGVGNHLNQEYVSTHPAFFTNSEMCKPVITFTDKTYFDFVKPISIGNDVWIGANAIILDGISVGDGAIIGAGAIVTKDVPSYAVVGGVPAKVIKYRFTQGIRECLLNSQWWHQDINWLKKNASMFRNVFEFK